MLVYNLTYCEQYLYSDVQSFILYFSGSTQSAKQKARKLEGCLEHCMSTGVLHGPARLFNLRSGARPVSARCFFGLARPVAVLVIVVQPVHIFLFDISHKSINVEDIFV